MSRYIDAEKLCLEILEEYGIRTGGDDATEIYGMIINQPTADVIEVGTGKRYRVSEYQWLFSRDTEHTDWFRIVRADT